MRRLITALVASIALVAGALPATAVTNGTLDGDGHPYVGLMVAQDGDGKALWRCSGTLISPTVYLTAGHCTEAPAEHVEIWFDADVESGIPANGYPTTGEVGGTPYTHSDYDPGAFYVRDLGMVVLERDFASPNGVYGALPDYGEFDSLKPSRHVTFTAVGYGLQKSFPDPQEWMSKTQADRVRMVSYPHLLQINRGLIRDYSMLLSNNANTGGTCFGDSGGPNFYGDTNTIAGVTSFGMNGTCAGTGGVFRVDKAWALDWIYEDFGQYLP